MWTACSLFAQFIYECCRSRKLGSLGQGCILADDMGLGARAGAAADLPRVQPPQPDAPACSCTLRPACSREPCRTVPHWPRCARTQARRCRPSRCSGRCCDRAPLLTGCPAGPSASTRSSSRPRRSCSTGRLRCLSVVQQATRPPTAPEARPLALDCPVGQRWEPALPGCQRRAAVAPWCLRIVADLTNADHLGVQVAGRQDQADRRHVRHEEGQDRLAPQGLPQRAAAG